MQGFIHDVATILDRGPKPQITAMTSSETCERETFVKRYRRMENQKPWLVWN